VYQVSYVFKVAMDRVNQQSVYMLNQLHGLNDGVAYGYIPSLYSPPESFSNLPRSHCQDQGRGGTLSTYNLYGHAHDLEPLPSSLIGQQAVFELSPFPQPSYAVSYPAPTVNTNSTSLLREGILHYTYNYYLNTTKF
jgi:hypothetical protein